MPATEALASALADRYAIERLIGEGGMATVYLARDLRHNRRVALKVLRPDLGAVVGVERFLAEIEVTANLQHPNLLPLFDSGAAGELLFYVMPFVQGESLRVRLNREKQLPVDEAVRMATAIAGALDYAHRQGVIHRDLKPENVLLQEGQPLVADFGIALAVSNAGGTRITQTGLSLGTPHYMSPEQATGDRVIDGRTDIYSLGALTYEMLTGEPPHVGSTSQAIISRVLTERPRSIRASRPSVPEHVEAAVEKALEKLPADRWPTAREFSEGLAGARPVTRSATSAAAALTSASAAPLTRGTTAAKRRLIREATAWALAAAGIATATWALTRAQPDAPMTRLAVELPDSVGLNGSNVGTTPSVALSRDGRTLAFVGAREGRRTLFVRRIDDREARELAGTENASHPVFSADGSWLAFIDGQRSLRKLPVTGGTLQLLADSVGSASWGDDGRIYFTRADGLWAMDAEGGAPRLLAATDTSHGVYGISQVDVLPGSELALVRIRTATMTFSIGVVDLRAGRIRDLRLAGVSPRYVAPGFLLYASDVGVLSAVPFSARKRTVAGSGVRVAEGVETLTNGGLDYGVGGNGTVVFRWARGGRLEPTQLALVDRRGTARVIRRDGHYDQPRLAPDGRHLAVRLGGAAFNDGDVWVVELASGALTRLTSGNGSYRASWSRDGKRIYYLTGDPGTSAVMSKPWDGSGTDSIVLKRPGIVEFAEGPPGGWSVLRSYASRDILIVPTDSIATAQPRPFVTGPSNETDVALSPSGRLLAYQSDETGHNEVYVRPVPGPGPRVPVSVSGGAKPLWSPDGGTLYFFSGTRLMSASITERPALAVTRRDSLFTANVLPDALNTAIMPNGNEFVTVTSSDARTASPYRLAVISNWQSLFAKPIQQRKP